MRLRLILALALAGPAAARGQTQPVIIDTDVGSDDIMAMAFLLAQPGVPIEAITVANGTAHVDSGARNVIRLLDVAGRGQVPVFKGRNGALRGIAEFPGEWRQIADELPGVQLPPPSRKPEAQTAAQYLIERLRHGPSVRILALGPLTNLGEALQRDPSISANISEIVIMGGAVHARGNLGDGGVYHTDNTTAEWNIFVDPLAARIVFRSGVPIRLIALDATNKVPIDARFLHAFEEDAHSPLGRVAAQVLEADHDTIAQGIFFAWDPLAAVAMLHPGVVKTARMHIEIRQDPPEAGRTAQSAGAPNAEVAIDADASAFRKLFLEAFAR
ncbi:MAG TPA: nucleoside hydrolase [Bryobacteraceae bacterium]|nr:nucleoside hydrolase [Bryobacteraceae bacterium]